MKECPQRGDCFEIMSDIANLPDGMRIWGYILDDGTFCPLPIQPMVQAGLGPPPFNVTLPSGETRHVIETLEAGESSREEAA